MLPSPKELKAQLPLTEPLRKSIASFRLRAKEIFCGKDPSIALMLGPCSIHNRDAALEYAHKLHALSKEVNDRFFVVMRTYVEKSRTGNDWKGFLHDPDLSGQPNVEMGLRRTRELFLELTTLGIPTASEFVDPLAALYYEDLVTWGFIGARTCSSQPHRQFASSLPFPIGIKNDLQGNVAHAVYGVSVANAPQTMLFPNEDGRLDLLCTAGNPHAHIVLRGSEQEPNGTPHEIEKALALLKNVGLPSKVMVDCSHGNSQKRPLKQRDVFQTTLAYWEKNPDAFLGVMIESYFEEGSQAISPYAHPYLSVTDPCLDWNTTREMILQAYSAWMSSIRS